MKDAEGMTKLEREISDLANKIGHGRASVEDRERYTHLTRWKARIDRGFGMKRRGWGYA